MYMGFTCRGVVAVLVFCSATVSPAQVLTTLANFDGTNGANSQSWLVQGEDGNFYGTTFAGGPSGDGVVFRITPAGDLTMLYGFCALANCADGSNPRAGLTLGTDGNFYGTTQGGGVNGNYGTVYRISPDGSLTTLHSFCEASCHAIGPLSGLVEGTNGNFYGTTVNGGLAAAGTIYEITPEGVFSILHVFCSQQPGCLDGASPWAGVVQAASGDFYGVSMGGISGWGNIFKITPTGAFTSLLTFCVSLFPCAPGTFPVASLVEGIDGDFYGTTQQGGINGLCTGVYPGCGSVFKVTPSGSLTTLHSFCSEPSCGDGANPASALVQGTDGNFYGTTLDGGVASPMFGGGTIFRVTPNGEMTTLYRFCSQPNCADGAGPGGLVQGTDGDFYGVTYGDGKYGYGTVFKLSAGLGPFVKTIPHSGKAGSAVKILGTDLQDVSAVSFGGTPAMFRAVSSTELVAVVPAGASTGRVGVVTASGVLQSAGPFIVR